jgi:hypothetical protein
MSLLKQLTQKKKVVVDKWFEAIVQSYPADAARFFRNTDNPFANPVGQTTRQTLDALFEILLKAPDRVEAENALTPLIRIRAVQAFTPAQALHFIFDLKTIVHTVAREEDLRDDMVEFERRIDELGLLAFNIYMQCREKIYELKANEVRSRTFKAFARAGLIQEEPGNPA